ncbi:hypothetical protein K491DRAFT_67084 [Lophiostoma macrostomum CBS 122681]|uniref:Uncharacterized protein n=1 Tax=Lophiostoma macrostomum CBS 122681 TaxID=1314788 RepID=A0A6A6SX56_9PLEO|nr:hypothetical protein K491DRAFT_67084 [Lophiostoma macrostomum CBS 122681]
MGGGRHGNPEARSVVGGEVFALWTSQRVSDTRVCVNVRAERSTAGVLRTIVPTNCMRAMLRFCKVQRTVLLSGKGKEEEDWASRKSPRSLSVSHGTYGTCTSGAGRLFTFRPGQRCEILRGRNSRSQWILHGDTHGKGIRSLYGSAQRRASAGTEIGRLSRACSSGDVMIRLFLALRLPQPCALGRSHIAAAIHSRAASQRH